MDPVRKERLIRELQCIIDTDEPPGMAARDLARSVVSLVQDRSGGCAIDLSVEIDNLARKYPRHGAPTIAQRPGQ